VFINNFISFLVVTSLSEEQKEDLSKFLSKYEKAIPEGRQYTILILYLYLCLLANHLSNVERINFYISVFLSWLFIMWNNSKFTS